jgi:predicted transcriptional regulator
MAEERIGISAKIARVQVHVGIPSDRFRAHLLEMQERGLILYGESLNSTEEGRYFVAEYEKLLRIFTRFNV